MEQCLELGNLEFDQSTHTVTFRFRAGGEKDHVFIEKIGLPEKIWSVVQDEKFSGVLASIHVLLGVSYWKIGAYSRLRVPYRFSSTQKRFWKQLYQKGMGEYLYCENLDPQISIEIEEYEFEEGKNLSEVQYDNEQFAIKYQSETSSEHSHHSESSQHSALVPFGGGKDSILSVLLLKALNIPVTAFMLRPVKLQQLLVEKMELRSVVFSRELDPVFLKKAEAGEYRKGHVPMTAIYTFLAVLAALAENMSWVVLSNEQSASQGNVEYQGVEINHQWSKSIEAESLMREYLLTVLPANSSLSSVFSLLRPLSEYKVVQTFVQKFEGSSYLFSSCNRNFSLNPEDRLQTLWCCECPKCAFVFVLLASMLSVKEVVQIFGKDMLNEPKLIGTFKELTGLTGLKPFECVGTPDEVRYAFAVLSNSSEWKDHVVVRSVLELDPTLTDEKQLKQLETSVMKNHTTHYIPETLYSEFSTLIFESESNV